jgi:hypothetical protein
LIEYKPGLTRVPKPCFLYGRTSSISLPFLNHDLFKDRRVNVANYDFFYL